jgi:hypothetical protein
MGPPVRAWLARTLAPLAVLLAFLALLAFRRDAVPPGLCNDTA